MKTVLRALIAAATLATAVSAPAGAAAPTVELRPGSLDRGTDVALPHMEGRVIVDGDVRIRVHAPRVELLGRSGTAYVVHTSGKDGYSNGRTLRVRPDGSTRLLGRANHVSELRLSFDGHALIRTRTISHERTLVRITDARSGVVATQKMFRGWLTALDASHERVLLSSYDPARTFSWNFATSLVRRISERTGYHADIRADRLAVYTEDPYAGGCSVVSSLRHPRTVLWRSCSERAVAFSPDGTRVASAAILADGLGPSEVAVRRTRGGAELARYATRWFGPLVWETDADLLLDTNGERKAATVRCRVRACERASDLRDAPRY